MQNFSKNASQIFYPKKILRRLNHRRIVFEGYWREQEVIAKIFITSIETKEVLRERFGYSAMQSCNIPLPKLLHQEKNKEFIIFIYEKINPGLTLKQVWLKLIESEKIKHFKEMALILSRLHQSGFIHQDLHFDNIISAQQKIYLLDYSSIRKTFKMIHSLSCYNNLAVFLSQNPNDLQKAPFFIEQYFKFSNIALSKIKKIVFFILLKYQIRKREKKFLKKIFRNCTSFKKIENKNFSGVCLRKYETIILPLFENPENFFSPDQSLILKNGNSATVIKSFIEEKEIVIKRYNIKNILHYLKKSFKKSRAWYAWRNAHALEFYNIPTASPIAWFRSKKWNLKAKGYFVCEYLDGENGLDYVNHSITPEKARQILYELIKNLHRYGLTHGDTKATNMIVVRDVSHFIDVDAVSCSRLKNKLLKRYEKDQERFEKNWNNNV